MNTDHLTDLISKCLNDSQIDLVLTEVGFLTLPKVYRPSQPFISITDKEGLLQAWTVAGDPVAEDLAEWVSDNIREWVYNAIDCERELHEPSDEKLAAYKRMLEIL